MYGDKCKNIDVKDIINVQVRLLLLAAGLFEDKAREKGLLNISTFFSNLLLCLKQDDFQITHTDERKGTKDYMKVSLAKKIASCFAILTMTRYWPIFVIEIVPSTKLSSTDFQEQKGILHKP